MPPLIPGNRRDMNNIHSLKIQLPAVFSIIDKKSLEKLSSNYMFDSVEQLDENNFQINANALADNSRSDGKKTENVIILLNKVMVRRLTRSIDAAFFKRKSIKISSEEPILITFDIPPSGNDPPVLFVYSLEALSLPSKEIMELILDLKYIGKEKAEAMKEISAVLNSPEMKDLEAGMQNLRSLGREDLIKQIVNTVDTNENRNSGTAFDPLRIASLGLGYEEHGEYYLKRFGENSFLTVSMEIEKAKKLAENISLISR
jgi:hypothetical protein